ncbi:MAG: hypothetical protein WCI22_06830 [Actinomycetota bacterium]
MTEALADPLGPFARRSRRGLRWVRVKLSDHTIFLPVVLRLTPRGTSRRITEHTALVIEGFPRSSNTFAAAAMLEASHDSIVVASHVHTPSQVISAARNKVPTLVVVREPRATVRSLIMAAPHVSVATAIAEWNHHHEVVWRHRESFVVGTFEQVTTDFGSVIDRINLRFGTDLPRFEHTAEALAAVDARIKRDHEHHHPGDQLSAPWPIEARKAASARLDDEFDLARHAQAWTVADEWWQRYCSAASA